MPGRKLQIIVATLALRAGGEVRRDELIEELDLLRSSGNAANTLHAHVARVRRWLVGHGVDPTVLESTPAGYRLGVSRSAVDAHRFTAGVEHALSLAPSVPSVVAAILEESLGLWRGDVLLDLADGPLAAAAADELRRLRSTARETLLDAWIALGDDRRVIATAKRFIRDDPLNERMRIHLITALRRAGRQAEAVEAYKSAERLFQDELGVGPGDGLREAFVTTVRKHRAETYTYSEF
ncbi:AfsR/SARP family transcriptional regulator [Nocardia pseudobrasiliensis]|uniref:AfsR/SARP family transcriptional regulator n=1 Tax=Nocardia pseudobrasiliensis TaxID=45979 RepID=UPI0014721443|nr:BTAD domain-containing putative transcriptional regulator [Nocardia pseudobrasiliensis]